MNSIPFTLFSVLAACVGLFVIKFSRYGRIDLKTAWKSYVLWWSGAFAVFGQFIAEGLSWLAGLWEPLQAQAGDLFANPTFGKSLQAIGVVFFLLRAKAQGFPSLKLPDFPDPTDQAGA